MNLFTFGIKYKLSDLNNVVYRSSVKIEYVKNNMFRNRNTHKFKHSLMLHHCNSCTCLIILPPLPTIMSYVSKSSPTHQFQLIPHIVVYFLITLFIYMGAIDHEYLRVYTN